MIFFVGNDGTIIKGMPSPVYQGAANSNTIYLIAPFATNVSVTVAFQLPNGVWTKAAVMTPQNALQGIVNEATGQEYAGWAYDLPNSITQHYGTVTAQFFFYSAQAGVITASSATSFQVGRGVPTVLPDTPTQDIYEQILENISSLQQQLNNGTYAARAIYAWNSAYTYGANEITYYKIGQWGALVRSKKADNTDNVPYTGEEWTSLNEEWWEEVINFEQAIDICMGAATQALASEKRAAESAQTAAASAGEAVKSAESAESAAGTAELWANNAANSATTAAESAGAALQSAQEAKESAEHAQEIVDGIGSVYKPVGSISFAQLPQTPTEAERGYVYNITDDFTTDTRFVEGAGRKYPGGTNVAVVLSGSRYKYDALSGNVDLTNYAQINGTYPNMSVGSAVNVTSNINGKAITNIFEADGIRVKHASTALDVTKNINGKAITTIFESDGITVKSATHAGSATNATNVEGTINRKPLVDIFETDGTTVKAATTASNAVNVTGKINGNLITDIFDTDGVSVKKAINASIATQAAGATNATNANNYNTSYGTIKDKFDEIDSAIADLEAGGSGVEQVVTSVNGTTTTGRSIYVAETQGTAGHVLVSSGTLGGPSWLQEYVASVNGSTVRGKSIYAPTTAGTTGQVLQSNGAGAAPTWTDASGGGGDEAMGYYGECSTAGSTVAKEVTIEGFTLATDTRVAIKWTNTNTASNPTLNINGTGAIAMYYGNARLTGTDLQLQRITEFVYDGTYYRLVGALSDGNDKVSQYAFTANYEYPILAKYNKSATTNYGDYVSFAAGITLNPSTKTITATKFKGKATDYDETSGTIKAKFDEIDAALGGGGSGGSGGGNPNILINPNFKINQRASSSYTESASGYIYTVDRWRICNGSVTSHPDGTVSVSFNQGYTPQFSQLIENYKDYLGKTVTLTAKVSNVTGTIKISSAGMGGTTITADGIYSNTVTLSTALVQLLISVTNNYEAASATIEWIKLEVGDTATPYTPPDPAEELAKCQRYFVAVEGQIPATAAGGTTNIYPFLNLPVTMRVNPTITVTKAYSVRGNGAIIGDTTNITVNTEVGVQSNGVALRAVSSGLTDRQQYSLHNGAMTLDAEL